MLYLSFRRGFVISGYIQNLSKKKFNMFLKIYKTYFVFTVGQNHTGLQVT